jgi:hypothetical protein
MSGEEKAAQIGIAVTEYQTAKVELAHLEKILETIFKTYLDLGSCMDRSRGSVERPRIKDGKLSFGWRAHDFDPTNLLNAEDLMKVLREQETAQARFDAAKKTLTDLGITGLS